MLFVGPRAKRSSRSKIGKILFYCLPLDHYSLQILNKKIDMILNIVDVNEKPVNFLCFFFAPIEARVYYILRFRLGSLPDMFRAGLL